MDLDECVRIYVNGLGRMCANLHVNLCVVGASMLMNVWVRERIRFNICESTCEALCLGRTYACGCVGP